MTDEQKLERAILAARGVLDDGEERFEVMPEDRPRWGLGAWAALVLTLIAGALMIGIRALG